MKPAALLTLAFSCLAGSALAAPAQEMPSQAGVNASAATATRTGVMTNCAAYRFSVAVDTTLRFISGVKLTPDPNGEAMCLRLRTMLEGSKGKGKRSDGLGKRAFKPFGFLFGNKAQNKDSIGKNPFGLGKDGKNLDFLKALRYGAQLDKKLRSGQKVDLESELESQFGTGSYEEKPVRGGRGQKDNADVGRQKNEDAAFQNEDTSGNEEAFENEYDEEF